MARLQKSLATTLAWHDDHVIGQNLRLTMSRNSELTGDYWR